VKVISYDRLITNTTAVDYYVTFDSISVGAAQAQYLVDKATGTGNPLYLYAGAASDNNAFIFFEGAWGVLQPKIADGTFVIKNSAEAVALQGKATLTRDEMGKIIGQITTNWDFNVAKNLAEANLTAAKAADKGVVFILAPNDGTARAIADAFAADTAVTKYTVTGQDAEIASVQYIIDGKQSMTVLKDVRTLVADAIAAAVAYLEGKTPAQTHTYNNLVFDVPAKPSAVVSVDKANVKAAIIDSGYYTADKFTGLDTLGEVEVPTEAPVVCEKPLKIAIIGAMSGTNAALGEWMVRGVQLAVEEKNAAGGIKGCQLELLVYDDAADCTTSVTLAQKVISEDDVIAAWATTNSSCVLATLPMFQEAKIPQMTFGTNVTITKQGSPFIFRSCPAGPAFEVPLVDYFVGEGYTKFAIIGDNTAYGKGEAQYQTDALAAKNLTPLAYEQHGADDKDFSGQLTKIIGTEPEVLLIASSEVAAGLIAKQARQLGFEGKMGGGQAVSTPKFLEAATAEFAEGIYFTSGYPGNDYNDQTRAFAKAYLQRWSVAAETHGANVYDLMQVLFIAMEAANPLTPENVAAEMHKVCGYQGLQGVMCVAENGETLTKTMMGQWLADGIFEFLAD
jgi:putative multiple sugar transport system substrate-binding protein